MSPAVRRALAHCYVTGRLPAYIHLTTWSAAQDCLGPMNSSACYRVAAEHLASVRAEPLAVASDFLAGCGFTWRNRLTGKRAWGSDSLGFEHGADDSLEAYATRHGNGWIWLRRKSVPFQVSLHYSAESIAAYQRVADGVTSERIAAGWRVAWPIWIGVVQHLLGAERAHWLDESAAMGWHAAGRDPIAYAVAAVRKAYGDSPCATA